MREKCLTRKRRKRGGVGTGAAPDDLFANSSVRFQANDKRDDDDDDALR